MRLLSRARAGTRVGVVQASAFLALLLHLSCGRADRDQPLECGSPVQVSGVWSSVEVDPSLSTSHTFASDGENLLALEQRCLACQASLLDSELHWKSQSNEGSIDMVVGFVASSAFVFGQGGVSWTEGGITRLDGRALLLDRSAGVWSVHDHPPDFHLRDRAQLFSTAELFGVWGGFGPADLSKTPAQLAADPSSVFLTHYDGLLFEPLTAQWWSIPPARAAVERLRSDPGPSLASIWTSSGLFVWGTNPERDGNWGALFDVDSLQWTELDASGALPPVCTEHQLLTVGGDVYLFGGKSADGEKSRRVFRYQLEEGVWSEVQVPRWADPRTGAVVDGKLVFLGECDNGARYDPATDSWDALAGGGPPSLGAPRSAGSFLTVTDTFYGEIESNEVWILDLRE